MLHCFRLEKHISTNCTYFCWYMVDDNDLAFVSNGMNNFLFFILSRATLNATLHWLTSLCGCNPFGRKGDVGSDNNQYGLGCCADYVDISLYIILTCQQTTSASLVFVIIF